MMENKPHIIVRALGWAILVTSLWSWLGFALGWLWSFPIVFLCVFGIVLSAPLETVLSSRERWHWHRAEVARLQREAVGRVAVSEKPEIEETKSQTREEAARAFWIRACRVAEATGNPGWRNGYKNFLSSDKDWQVWIKAPLVAAGFAIPKNTGNGETIIWREGIDPRYVRGWLVSNLLPLPQEGWPPQWRKPQTGDSPDSGNRAETAADRSEAV